MSTIDRASLPQEFFDVTSARLLVQPEPQYSYARLFVDALGAAPPNVEALGHMSESFGAGGAPYMNLDEMMSTFSKNVFRDAITVVPEIGARPGHTVRINRPAFTDGVYTLAAREIPSGSTISTTGQSVSAEQVSLTLKRFGGPGYSGGTGANSVRPLSIERFDAGLSLHQMVGIADIHIKRDFHRWVHYVIATLLDGASTSNNVFPDGKSAVTDFVAAGDGPMSFDMVLKAGRIFADANIPMFSNGRWGMTLAPRQVEQLKKDPSFKEQAVFHQEYNTLFQGLYVGTVGDFDVFRTTALNTGTNAGVTYYKGHIFGPGALGAGVGGVPRVAHSTNNNFGETDLIIWLMYAAFSLLDSRFAGVIYTD